MPLCSLSLDLSCRHVVHPMVYSLDYSVFVPADGESRNQQERKKKKKRLQSFVFVGFPVQLDVSFISSSEKVNLLFRVSPLFLT